MVLLGQKRVGRLAVAVEGDIHVIPVNYALDGGTVVFHTGPSTVRRRRPRYRRVTLEVDDIDEPSRRGWSICVKGLCSEITDATDEESRRLGELDVETWAPGARPRLFKISPAEVTGRALYPTPR